MGNLLKKLFSSFVALTTIAWSVGIGTFALPTVARAATPGDLIKASGPAVYYYAADNKRYVFPNEKTYFSWFSDFSSVRTISDAELASILIGGNVTIRPGTKLVKIQTDPKTYAVSHDGVLHWVESEAIATALYGSAWNTRIVDVPDSFFVNYAISSSISSAAHPDGTLIKYADSADIYVMAGGMKRRFTSAAAFAANGYKMSDVITTTIAYGNGSDVTGREGRLADVIYISGTTPVGGNLNVTLASDTPAGVTVPKNANSVPLAKWNFTAGSSAALLTGLTIQRVGVGATTDLENVYLYDGNGNRLTTGRTINSSTNQVSFNALNITVAAGTTKSLMLWGDFSSPSTTGGQHAFEVSDAASVVISGSGTVSGSFPLRGNTFTVGTASAARVDVQKGTTPTNPNIGAEGAEISNFKLTANSEDVEIRRITLIQAGSVSNTDLTNLKLYQGTTLVAQTAALTGDKIVLNFNPPFLLTDGTTRTFSLKADIGGRSARTIKTYVEYTTDVYAVDQTYNIGADVCITSSGDCSTGSFDGTSTNYIEVTTQGGQLTTTFNGPVTSNVAKGQQDVQLFRFSLTSQTSALEIRKLYFNIEGETSSDEVKGGSGTEYFTDIKIKDANTGAIFMGPISMPSGVANSASDTGTMTFSDTQVIQPGVTYDLVLTADLSNTEDVANEFFGDGNNRYRVVMDNGSSALFGSTDVRIVDTGEYLATSEIVPNSVINGNYHTVKASSLSVSLAATPSSGTAVKKQTMIPSVGFVFTAGSESAMLVQRVTLTGRADVATTSTYALADLNDVVTECALFDGDTQVGTSESPDGTTGAMAITGIDVTVPAGTSKTLVAKCTADSVVDENEDTYAIGIAAAADVVAQDEDSNSVTATLTSGVTGNAGASPTVTQVVKDGGTLTVQTDNLRQSTILVAGGDVWHNFAQFKATAQNEAMELQRIAVTSTGDAANFTAIAVAQGGTVLGQNTLPAGSDQNRDVVLTTPISVPKDGSTTFQIWGKLANLQSSSTVSGATSGVARSGNQVALGVAAGLTSGDWDSNYSGNFNIRAVGQASGDLIYDDGSDTTGNTFVIRKTKPTVARQSLGSTTLANGTDQDLFKYTVSADSAGSVAVKKMTFTVSRATSSGSSLSLSNFRLRKGTSDFALADVVITDENGTDLEAGSLSGSTTATKVVVTFTTEETISGSGTTYTLHATVAGSVVGDTVTTSLYRDPSQNVTTGYLVNDAVSGLYQPNIDTATASDGTADVIGTFVWSDNSEVPHSSTPGTSSSRDWTNDTYVEDLTSVQTLSR